MSEVRRGFLEIVRVIQDRHDKEIAEVLDIMASIPDKHSQAFKDATMILRFYREMADLCKRTIRQYS